VNPAPFHAIGVDIGGTKIAAGIVSFPEGAVLTRQTIPTLAHRRGEEILSDLENLIRHLIAQSREPIGAIGLGICEIVTKTGLLASDCAVHWSNLSVDRRLGALAPTIIESDVRAAATAEALFGAGRNADPFLYVTIGTGISSCLVLNGEPYAGARGATGTLASGPFPSFNPPANLTLEQFASGPALAQRYGVASAQEVLAAATSGDPRAIEVVRTAAEALGGSLGWLINILDPTLVVLGGGLGLASGLYRETLTAACRRNIWWPAHRDLPIVSAATGLDGGLIGAGAAAWKLKDHS
jgi:glucokinase